MGYIILLQKENRDLRALAKECELWESSYKATALTIFLLP